MKSMKPLQVPQGRWRLAGDEITGTCPNSASRPEGTLDGAALSGAAAGARDVVGARFRRCHRRLISTAPPALKNFCKRCNDDPSLLLKLQPRAFVLSLLIALLAPVSVWAADFGDIAVQVEAITDSGKGHDYDEYRATISNRSPSKTRQVTLLLAREFDRLVGQGIREIRRTVEVAPAATVTVSLFAPRLAPESGEVAVIIDGQRQRDAVIIDYARTSAWTRHARDNAQLLISAGVSQSNLMNHEALLTGFNNSETGESDVAYLSYKSPLAEWSRHWLAYVQFHGVLVTADELRAAPEEVRMVLLRYVEAGGTLVVLGAWPVPAAWQGRRQIIGDGETLGEAQAKTGAKVGPDVPRYFIGFGELIVTGAVDPRQIASLQWAELNQDWQQARIKQSDYYDLAAINRAFPVVTRIGIPVRGLFVLMFLFVIVIGPVNLLWLARRRRKIWMLWTVPLLSLLTCLAVSGFAFFSEGWSATARTESLTILDETAHRATTIGWTAFYAPVTPSDGLHFSYDTELRPQLIHYRSYGRSNRVLDWTNDQHLVTDWVTARVPAYFKLRKSEVRRERMSIRQEANGEVSVVNGLGAQISQFWWANGDGKIYGVKNIAAGAPAKLELLPGRATGAVNSLRGLLGSDDWPAQIKVMEEDAYQYLRPGSYLAVLEANPFVEAGLENVKTRQARAVVYGIQADAVQASTVLRP